MSRAFFAALLVVLSSLSDNASAQVILSRTGAGMYVGDEYLNHGVQDVVLSFTLTDAFQNVGISIPLGKNANVTTNATAYLTTQIGAGTTAAADQIAATTFSPAYTGSVESSPVTPTLLFSGLSLNSGTYYLVLTSNSSEDTIGWQTSIVTSTTSLPGTAVGQSLTDVLHLESSYIPASDFGSASNTLLFSITGTEVAAPEPSTWVLLLVAGAFLALLRRQFVQRHGR